MTGQGLNIIIIGAGIGGPVVAIGLARNGHQVTIYERSQHMSEVGYAFRITPNPDRCLKHLGIDTVAGGAVAANTSRLMDVSGRVEVEHRENENANTKNDGRTAKSVFAYRPQLHQQLMEMAVKVGVGMEVGVAVKEMDVQGTKVVLEDKKVVAADLVIAADGVRSVVRRSVVLETGKYFSRASTKHNAFRFMVPRAVVEKDEILSSKISEDIRMFSLVGNRKRILVYPVDYDRQFNVTCTHPEHLSDPETRHEDTNEAIAYNQKASFETVQKIYSEFDPAARRLLELADPNGFRIWKLTHMDEIPHWGLNHTILLGDAYHPVSPFGFSGASMAIEDALTLSTLITPGLRTEGISDRLKLYEEIRRPRVGRVRDTARMIAQGLDDNELVGEYRRFLEGHDAVEYAPSLRKALLSR